MNNAQVRRLISVLDFFAGLFFGISLLGAFLSFQMMSTFMASLFVAICVFGIFAFMMIMTRYFIAKIDLELRQVELLEKIESKLESK